MAIRRIYHREYDVIRSFTLSLNGGESQYSLNGIRWTKDTDAEESGTVTYTAELAEAIPTDVLAVMVSDETVINGKQIEVDISNDGESWAALSEMNDYSAYGRRLSAESMIHELKYIRIRLSGVLPENLSITVLPCGYQSNVAAMGETDNPSVEDIGSNVQTDSDLRAIIDGNTGTRWETSTQQAGMYVEVSLADICTVSGVRLQLGESPWDYPRNLEIYWSVDGENWELLDAATTDNELYLFDAVECRYLRFELGETEETVTSNWSIYELELLAKVE